MNDPAPDGDLANVWSTLRRRKVVQWGLVYVAAAWGFLQGLEYLSGTYDWPRQIQQLTTLALLIGLPVVLVLAWYHGDRGQQRITTPEFAILTLLLLLGGGAFWYYQQRASETEQDVEADAVVTVRDLPSAATTFFCVVVTFPPFLATDSSVFASTRFTAIMSAFGLLPVTGTSFPSRSVVKDHCCTPEANSCVTENL